MSRTVGIGGVVGWLESSREVSTLLHVLDDEKPPAIGPTGMGRLDLGRLASSVSKIQRLVQSHILLRATEIKLSPSA